MSENSMFIWKYLHILCFESNYTLIENIRLEARAAKLVGKEQKKMFYIWDCEIIHIQKD